MKLEPTEAQRKAMATRLCASFCLDEEVGLYEVDRQIAAANSVPEGAPVGTIARRPDGFWIAHMTESGWEYTELVTGTWRGSDADSWPVIFTPGEAVGSGPTTDGGETHDPREPSREELRAYFHQDLAEHCQADDPDEYHEGDKPRLERQMREPSVFDADPHGTVNLDGTLPTFTPDPTAQQEPPKGLYGKYRVERVDGKPIRACFVLEYLDDLHANKALLEYAFSVERVNPELAKDLRTEWGKWPGRSQQEPAYTVAAASEEMAKYWDNSIVTTTKRVPRVVDRLGVDEQGSRWRDENGLIHSFTEGADGGRWKTQIGGSWYPWAKGVVPHGGEYTEIVEPRVLPSLDCEEARDGTVWRSRNGFHYQHPADLDSWRRRFGADETWEPLSLYGHLVHCGPYTEVLGDPS